MIAPQDRAAGIRVGDVNAFLALLVDNLAALILFVTLATAAGSAGGHFPLWFVLTWMVPGTLVGVLLGGTLYTLLASRLARAGGRDVTAMPLGLDTPSCIAVTLFILLPVYQAVDRMAPYTVPAPAAQPADRGAEGAAAPPAPARVVPPRVPEGSAFQFTDGFWALFQPRDRLAGQQLALFFAWNVGMVVLVLVGLVKAACAPLAPWVRRHVPPAALVGSLIGVTLALITFLPLVRELASIPLVGLPTLMIVLIALLAPRMGWLNQVPVTVIAMIVGLALYVGTFAVGAALSPDLALLPLPALSKMPAGLAVHRLPDEAWQGAWWAQVLATALQMLPVALPLALATVVGGLQCTASANAAGDPYEARDVLLLDAVATLAGGLCGGVVPTTAYYGHPAYKTMGARVSFPLLTGLVLFLVGYLGWFIHFFDWIPPVVLYAAIVFVGLRTITHGLESVEAKYFAAVLLATVPVLAYLANLAVNLALGNRPPDPDNALFLQTLRGLGNGFILTGLLWAGALVALIDGAFRKAAAYLGVAAGAALLGVIHSPLVGAGVALPWNVMAQLPASAIYQTPYHWAAAYALTAGFLVLAERLPNWKWPARRAASPATPPGPEMPPAEVPPPPAAEPQPTAG